MDTVEIEIRDSLSDVAASQWNAMNHSGNPFLCHEFLYALECTECLGDSTGWYPRYFLLWKDSPSADGTPELVAASAAYIKTNSYGEFVFDWAWADAYQRNELNYYPKLVCAVPFTPATGQRLLVRDDQPYQAAATALVAAMCQYAETEDFSSVHFLFVNETDGSLLEACDLLSRNDCQYHWHNQNYGNFDDFLAQCTAKRRKTIRRERRFVSDAGLRLDRRRGSTLTAQEWRWVTQLYQSTYDRKWGSPSLTQAFFERIGETMGDQVLIVLAYDDQDPQPDWPVACSIMFTGTTVLYGRYWGCRADYHSLHFEACYYQGIEHCITENLSIFEPGAQGEHKITRGFVPTITRSAHHIRHPQFRDAIANYLEKERLHTEQRCTALGDLLPFKADTLSL